MGPGRLDGWLPTDRLEINAFVSDAPTRWRNRPDPYAGERTRMLRIRLAAALARDDHRHRDPHPPCVGTAITLSSSEDGSPLGDIAAWSSDHRQGHEVLPRLLDLLTGAGLALARCRAVAVGLGPGSFTGLRVGLSIAKGIAFSLDLPIVGVPSLEAWLAAEPQCRVAVARAGAGKAYLLARRNPMRGTGCPDSAPSPRPRAGSRAFGLRLPPPDSAAEAVAMRDTMARVAVFYFRLCTQPDSPHLSLL